MEQLLARAEISETRLAEIMNVSEGTIRNWCQGRTEPTLTPKQTASLVNALHCSLFDLIEAVAESRTNPVKRKPGRKPKKS